MANQYTKLFINNQAIDLNKSEALPLNITRRVNSIEGDIKGDYSRVSITVPATKNNIDILGKTRAYLPFRIEGDGAPDFHGAAQAKTIKTYSQGYAAIEEGYEINLISNNTSWFVLLGNTFLSDLTDLVVNFDEAEILLGLVSQPSVIDYCFAPIKWKEWEHFTGVPPDLQYNPSYFEMTPCLFYKPLITAAFNSIGYTIESEFMESDLFIKLALDTPIPLKMPAGYNDKYLTTKVSNSLPISLPNPTVGIFKYDTIDVAAPLNPTAYVPATGEYTLPLDGYYEISISWAFSAAHIPALGDVFIAAIFFNGAVVSPSIGFGWTGPAEYPSGKTLTASTIVLGSAGDKIRTDIAYGGVAPLPLDGAIMTIVGEATSQQGMPIDFKFLLGKLKFNEMLLGFKDLFNLGFETNDITKIVKIEPLDGYISKDRVAATSERKEGFYKDTVIKDYSKLIDYQKKSDIRLQPMEGLFDFKYKSDSDATIEFIEGINPIGIYQSQFPMSSGADTSKVKTIEVPFFAKTIHVLDQLAKYPGTNRVPQFLLIYPQNYVEDPTATVADYDKSPRVFYFAGQRTGFEDEDGTMQFFENIGVPALVPAAFVVNYNDDTGLDPNLGFDNQIINGVESIGLMQNHYLQKLARDDKGELYKNYVKFNSTDSFNFSFRIKGIIDGQRFIVQQIRGFNPLIDSPSEFNFYLDVFPDSNDINNIINSPLTGVVLLLVT